MPRNSDSNGDTISIVRRAYAKQMLALAGIAEDPHLEDAFASVPRERYLGGPPWRVSSFNGYRDFPSDDPVAIYQDINIALAPERGINNGSPSLHARWLHHAGLKRGDDVAHIGAGTGYYTALVAHLVGPKGRVTAVEFDPALAELARRNLFHLANVTVVEGDGGKWPNEMVDTVYVNFSVTRPADAWIDHLKPHGRLIFPLGVPRPRRSPAGGVHALHGAGLKIERRDHEFAAKWMGPAYFVCAEGSLEARDSTEALATAFQRGGIEFVRSLRWKQPCAFDRCWFVGSDWGLSYDEVKSVMG